MLRAALPIALLTVFFVPGAHAASEASQGHTIVEADTARSTALGSPWESHQAYGVSLLHLWESGQGFGARFAWVPSSSSASAWELSSDAVARFANEGPWYFKGLGGIAVAPRDLLWAPQLRAGAEVGLNAIRGGIGLEAGLSAIYSFPPARPLDGQVVVSLGVGVLFGFGAPSPSASSSPMVKLALAAAPVGSSFNTCEGSKATPQCLQAMSQGEGAASTSATSPPAPGATTATAAPAQAGGAGASTAPGTAPSATPAPLPGWKAAAAVAASMGAALGLESDEQRTRKSEHARLMEQSARTLEALRGRPEGVVPRLEPPASEPSLPWKEPGGTATPRVDSQTRAPLSAPGPSGDQAISEPDDTLQSPLELENPHGQHGKPDHQATVKRLKELARREFPNAVIETGTSIKPATGVNRRPDVWVFDEQTQKVLKVYEAARINPDGSLPRREQVKRLEYDRAGIPNHFEPVTP